jgi:hypothetical protein
VGIVFVTFAAGRTGWRQAGRRVVREAKSTNLFEESMCFNEEWLFNEDRDIYNLIAKYRSEGAFRGFGYWLWKPAILKWTRDKYPNSNILYVDAGTHIDTSPSKISMLGNILEQYVDNGLAWQLHHKEYLWTKQELIERMKPSISMILSGQIQSGFLYLPISKSSVELVNTWRQLALERNGFFFSDELDNDRNQNLIEHRHDQSVLSLLWKFLEFDVLPDETYPENLGKFPIVATRNNTGLSAKSNKKILFTIRHLNALLDRVQGIR